MSKTKPGSWWASASGPPETTDSTAAPAKTSDSSPSHQETQAPNASFWTWPSASFGSVSAQKVPNGISDGNLGPAAGSGSASLGDLEDGNASEGWWSSMLDYARQRTHQAAQITNTSAPDTSRAKGGTSPDGATSSSDGWLSWMFFSTTAIAEQEEGEGDKTEIEAFREAKLAIESCRDSCHYAVAQKYGIPDLYLSVAGTGSETRPVKTTEKNRPLLQHELFEKTLAVARPKKLEAQASEANIEPISKKCTKISPVNDTKDSSKNPNESDSKNELTSASAAVQDLERTKCDVTNSKEPVTGVESESKKKFSGVIPTLDTNFRVLTAITKLRLWGEALFLKEKTSEKHLYKSSDLSVYNRKRRARKHILVISVHSFLPTKFVRSAIAQSTGNSLLLAQKAMDTIYNWVAECGSIDFDMHSISLDGIGTSESRIENSLKLLDNWSDWMMQADYVFIVSNSIASPIALRLLVKLISTTNLGSNKRKIGVLSIGGAMEGTYPGVEYKVVKRAYTSTENDILREVFELQKPTSIPSTLLRKTINTLCQMNVKMTMSGSITDQFVPLNSSVASQTRHPNIFRCVTIEENANVPGFMLRLISMVLTMENVGYSDHNLLKEISDFFQGPASAVGSHGDIYSNDELFVVGVRFFLETTSLVYRQNIIQPHPTSYTQDGERSLYHLPWIVRGLVNDLISIRHINGSQFLKDLVEDYKNWKPTTRPWRDIKPCFAAIEDINLHELLL